MINDLCSPTEFQVCDVVTGYCFRILVSFCNGYRDVCSTHSNIWLISWMSGDVYITCESLVISLLLVWMRTRPFSILFSPLLMRCAKLCSLNQTFVTAHAQSQHPEKLGHVSFHIKILGSTCQGKT